MRWWLSDGAAFRGKRVVPVTVGEAPLRLRELTGKTQHLVVRDIVQLAIITIGLVVGDHEFAERVRVELWVLAHEAIKPTASVVAIEVARDSRL
jgi:hypothetical protein